MLKTVPQGPDLQNLTTILRLSYDNANVTIDDGRLIYQKSYEERRANAYVRFTCKIVRLPEIVFVN